MILFFIFFYIFLISFLVSGESTNINCLISNYFRLSSVTIKEILLLRYVNFIVFYRVFTSHVGFNKYEFINTWFLIRYLNKFVVNNNCLGFHLLKNMRRTVRQKVPSLCIEIRFLCCLLMSSINPRQKFKFYVLITKA